jgi:hypothetical protein
MRHYGLASFAAPDINGAISGCAARRWQSCSYPRCVRTRRHEGISKQVTTTKPFDQEVWTFSWSRTLIKD